MKLLKNIVLAAAGAVLAASCTVGDILSDSSSGSMPEVPYDLEVSGMVIESSDGRPVSGVEVVLLSYESGDIMYNWPLNRVSTVSDAGGKFSIQAHEVRSGVAYRLSAGGKDSSGRNWDNAYVGISIYSGSPSYDSASDKFVVDGIVLPLSMSR